MACRAAARWARRSGSPDVRRSVLPSAETELDRGPVAHTIPCPAQFCAVSTSMRGPRNESYERALFLRLKSRRGPLEAIVAVAASMLGAIYYILRDNVPHRSLCPDHFDTVDREKARNRLVHCLNRLSCQVDLRAAARPEPPASFLCCYS